MVVVGVDGLRSCRVWDRDLIANMLNGSDQTIGASPTVGLGAVVREDQDLGFSPMDSDCLKKMMGSGLARRPRHFGQLGSSTCTTVGELAAGSHGCRPW
ncbi:hypothetical protein ACLOJK_037662 [Asimina triloba]